MANNIPTDTGKKETRKMKFESVLPLIGEFGPYQKRIYFLLCLPVVCCAMHKLAWVFLGAKVSFRCKLPIEGADAAYELPDNISKSFSFPADDSCRRLDVNYSNYDEYVNAGHIANESIKCDDGYVYDTSKYESSAFMQYNLVCDHLFWHATAQALFMVGVLLGSIVFGVLSDMFGRRPIFFFSLVIQVVFGILAGFAPEYFTFVIARLIVGASTSGVFLVGFVIAMEMVGPSKRVVAGVVCQYFYTAGFLVTGTMAYLIKDWKHLQIALSVPGIVFLCYWWFLPESIRWLLMKGRREEAIVLLKKVAKENKVELPDEVYDGLHVDQSKDKTQVNFLQIIHYPRLSLRAANIFFNWFVNSGVYYGLSLNTSNLGGNDYVNFLISGAVEVPAYAFLLISLNRLGRKYVLCGCMLAGGFFMAICAVIPENLKWLLIASSMTGKLCITASYGVIYIATAENFPTPIRNAGIGASSMCARVGGILAAYVLELGALWKPLPLLLFGGVSLLGGALALLIPETLGKRLPETLEDGERFGTADYDESLYINESNGTDIPLKDTNKIKA